ncbi:MAG: TonB-dependent siderophore receptor [Pseudomonadota bacterium]
MRKLQGTVSLFSLSIGMIIAAPQAYAADDGVAADDAVAELDQPADDLQGNNPQADVQDEEEDISEPDMIIVSARARTLYSVNETDTAKLPSDPLNSPIVITSINEQLIEDQGARDAQDIYRNISGVTLFSYAGVTARGFRQEEIFYDGLRGDPYIGFNVPQLFNIERLDYLKGPAGMLYGPGAPGGLFNYVTKKPEFDPSAEVRMIFGNRERFGGSAELTGPITDNIAARGGVFYEDQRQFRFNADERTLILDGGLTFDLGFADLIFQATHYDQKLGGNRLRGVPTDDDGNFFTTVRWNHNERTDFLNLRSTNLQALARGKIADSVDWNVTFRYTDASQKQEYHEPRALIDLDGDAIPDLVGREFRDQLREEEQYTLGANLIWSADLGPIQNRLLGGFEYFDATFDFLNGRANFNPAFVERFLAGTSLPGDIIPLELSANPNYNQTRPDLYNIQFGNPTVTTQERRGFYLLEEATIGPFILAGGIRYDEFEDDSNGTAFEDDQVTYRAGIVYKPQDDISLFAQWADSYQPQNPGSQDISSGGPFAPTTGEIIEAGIKTAFNDGRIRITLTAYEIKRQNLLQLLVDADGNSVDVGNDGVEDLAPLGEVTSRGIEFDVVADITDDWVFTLAYAYNDTKITEDNGGQAGISNSVGDRFANAPEHTLGFWTRYQVPAIDTAFAFGGDFVDDRLSLSGQTVQDYFVFDASIIWSPGPVEVLFRIDNIFDETFAASGFLERTGHFPGQPRTVFVELIKRW